MDIVKISVGPITTEGGGGTTVVDDLTSESTTSALSANQGRVLKGLIDDIGQGGDATSLQGQNGAYYLSRANHTGTQAATTITEDTTHRFVTDTEKTSWNNKVDAAGVAAATRLCDYTLVDANGSTLVHDFDVKGNTATLVTFENAVANGDGELLLACYRRSPLDANHEVGYINAMHITRNT